MHLAFTTRINKKDGKIGAFVSFDLNEPDRMIVKILINQKFKRDFRTFGYEIKRRHKINGRKHIY